MKKRFKAVTEAEREKDNQGETNGTVNGGGFPKSWSI